MKNLKNKVAIYVKKEGLKIEDFVMSVVSGGEIDLTVPIASQSFSLSYMVGMYPPTLRACTAPPVHRNDCRSARQTANVSAVTSVITQSVFSIRLRNH